MNTTEKKILTTYYDIDVLEAPHFGPQMIANMTTNNFEAREINAALGTITKQDRVLELGAGSGIVGAVVAKNVMPEKMLAFEPNPNLLPHINALYAHNGVSDKIEVRHGLLLSGKDIPKTHSFYIRGNYLGSGIMDHQKYAKNTEVTVPCYALADILVDFKPTVLMMDIEGAEVELLRDADLSNIRVVVLELHRNLYGREGMKAIKHAFARAGFVDDRTYGNWRVRVYTRQPEM